MSEPLPIHLARTTFCLFPPDSSETNWSVLTIFTDISEQVKFRDELFEAKQNLEQITQNANDLIFFYTYHPKPKYIYISPSIKKILGYTPQDFYRDGNLGSKIVVDKKGYKKFEAIIGKKQKNNTLKHTSTSFEYKTKSGKLVWLEDNYSPIYDESGKIKFVLGISRDITKEKKGEVAMIPTDVIENIPSAFKHMML